METSDKNMIIDVLRTMIYNTPEELKEKLIKIKKIISPENYKIMIYGDSDLFDDGKSRIITSLQGRWCLHRQLSYHLENTKKITQDEFNDLLKLF